MVDIVSHAELTRLAEAFSQWWRSSDNATLADVRRFEEEKEIRLSLEDRRTLHRQVAYQREEAMAS